MVPAGWESALRTGLFVFGPTPSRSPSTGLDQPEDPLDGGPLLVLLDVAVVLGHLVGHVPREGLGDDRRADLAGEVVEGSAQHLARDDSRALSVAVLQDLEQVVSLRLVEVTEAEVVEDEQVMLAEGCLCVALVEGVCRKALAIQPDQSAGFRGVLEVGVLSEQAVLRLPFRDQADGVEKILEVKNSLAHANYEEAADGAGVAGVNEYFKTQFASEIEELFRIYEHLLAQLITA